MISPSMAPLLVLSLGQVFGRVCTRLIRSTRTKLRFSPILSSEDYKHAALFEYKSICSKDNHTTTLCITYEDDGGMEEDTS